MKNNEDVNYKTKKSWAEGNYIEFVINVHSFNFFLQGYFIFKTTFVDNYYRRKFFLCNISCSAIICPWNLFHLECGIAATLGLEIYVGGTPDE